MVRAAAPADMPQYELMGKQGGDFILNSEFLFLKASDVNIVGMGMVVFFF